MLRTPTRQNTSESRLIILIGLLSAISPFTIDLYLPAFPDIAREFGATPTRVALSISTYFFGFSLGQLIYGPLLDRFGRKRPLYFGLSLYLLATMGCTLTHSIDPFLILRFVQALGGSVASVASMAMVRDFFPPEKGARVLSLTILILGASPLFAPTIGSWILVFASWRWIFYLLALGVSVLLVLMRLFLPEGHIPDDTVSLKPLPILRDFAAILRNRKFVTYSGAGALTFAGLFVYVAGSPAIFMTGFGVSAQVYGFIFGVLGSGMILGSQLSLVLGRRFSSEQIFSGVLRVRVVAAAIFAFAAWNGWLGLYATIGFLYVVLMTAGIAYPNGAAMAIAPFSSTAGRASALLGSMNLSTGAAVSSVVGMIDVPGTLPTAMTIAISSFLALGVLGWYARVSRAVGADVS